MVARMEAGRLCSESCLGRWTRRCGFGKLSLVLRMRLRLLLLSIYRVLLIGLK